MKIRFTNRTTLSMAALLSRLSWHFGPNGAAFAQLQEDTYAGVQDFILYVTFIIKLPCMGLLEVTVGAFGADTEERTVSAVTREWEGPDRLEQLACSFADKGKHPEEDRNDPIPAARAKVGDIVIYRQTPGNSSPLQKVYAVEWDALTGTYMYISQSYYPHNDSVGAGCYHWKEKDLIGTFHKFRLDSFRKLFADVKKEVENAKPWIRVEDFRMPREMHNGKMEASFTVRMIHKPEEIE